MPPEKSLNPRIRMKKVFFDLRILIPLLVIPCLVFSQRSLDRRTFPERDILRDREAILDPDPNIFDGTRFENFEREQVPQLSRVGETSYGKALEGKENQVKGAESPQEQQTADGQQEPMQGGGQGGGAEQDPQEPGGGMGGEDHQIQVEQPDLVGAAEGPDGKEEQAGGGRQGGGGGGGGMEQQGGGMSGNPLEMLKILTQAAQSKGGQQQGDSGQPGGDGSEEATFGNNPHQVAQIKSPEVVGGMDQRQEESREPSESSARESAVGQQERSREQRGGREVGDDVPTGL